MDTGCPSFIPEPENHEKPRVEPPKNQTPKEQGDLHGAKNFQFSDQRSLPPLSFIGKQFLPLP